MDSSSPCVSFIGIVDFSEQARWVFCTESVSELLGKHLPRPIPSAYFILFQVTNLV
ncbi:hypothetical protein BGW80DRAFT_1271473, partial [Lactifluus volemus]